MKKTLFTLIKLAVETRCIASLLMLAIAFASCEKNNGSDDPDTSAGGPWNITFTAVPDSKDNLIDFYATAQLLIVDWGDGSSPETYADVKVFDPRISHTYAKNNATYTVRIKGEELTRFYAMKGLLTALDVSGSPALEELSCAYNQLTSLDVSQCPALQSLTCNNNQITALDVRNCPELGLLWCHSNQLTALDVRQCPALLQLFCDVNQLTELDVSKCPALLHLYCGDNQLTELDVSKCPALEELKCEYNQLTSLDVSNHPALRELWCGDNQLIELDVSGCTALLFLRCRNNQLMPAALNTIFSALPYRDNNTGSININNNPGVEDCDISIAQDKGWW
jgi:Leucine-rich repeat (LRR) protein